jgi:hypothetical protein
VHLLRYVVKRAVTDSPLNSNAAVLRKGTSPLGKGASKCNQADGGHFEQFAWVLSGESVTVHLTKCLNKCTMLLFPF